MCTWKYWVGKVQVPVKLFHRSFFPDVELYCCCFWILLFFRRKTNHWVFERVLQAPPDAVWVRKKKLKKFSLCKQNKPRERLSTLPAFFFSHFSMLRSNIRKKKIQGHRAQLTQKKFVFWRLARFFSAFACLLPRRGTLPSNSHK